MKTLILFAFVFITFSQEVDSACWLRSYGRGVGKPISTCAPGLEQNGLLCYPKCQPGFKGVGPVCWQSCPNGFRDDGAFCFKPKPYGRGAGYVLWQHDKCQKENPQGCEKNGLLWYPKCKPGFHAVGCCICSPNCVDGQTDIGISCAKKSYGRTAGKPLTCTSDLELSGALCYPGCKNGYKGIGPVCWGSCPAGYTSCGALCLKGQSCSSKLMEYGELGGQIIMDAVSKAEAGPIGMIIGAIPGLVELGKDLVYPICP